MSQRKRSPETLASIRSSSAADRISREGDPVVKRNLNEERRCQIMEAMRLLRIEDVDAAMTRFLWLVALARHRAMNPPPSKNELKNYYQRLGNKARETEQLLWSVFEDDWVDLTLCWPIDDEIGIIEDEARLRNDLFVGPAECCLRNLRQLKLAADKAVLEVEQGIGLSTGSKYPGKKALARAIWIIGKKFGEIPAIPLKPDGPLGRLFTLGCRLAELKESDDSTYYLKMGKEEVEDAHRHGIDVEF